MRTAAAAFLACALATAASASDATPSPAVQRIGRLDVSVESVARPSPRSTVLTVTLRASATSGEARARVESAALVDVRGRRFEARRDGSAEALRPGAVTFAFEVPEDVGIVTLELNGRSFEIAHVNNLRDLPTVHD